MSDSSRPMDCSLPGSSVHGIFQARVLEWDAIAFSKENITKPQIEQHSITHMTNMPQNGQSQGFLGGSVVKNPPVNAGDRFGPWAWKIPQPQGN